MLQIFGYTHCEDGTLEEGCEKVAIYADSDGSLTHAARQLLNGQWTSKMGDLEDITHTDVNAVSGPLYGQVVRFMKREIREERSEQEN